MTPKRVEIKDQIIALAGEYFDNAVIILNYDNNPSETFYVGNDYACREMIREDYQYLDAPQELELEDAEEDEDGESWDEAAEEDD